MQVFSKIEEFADHIKEYVNTKIRLAKLQFAEKSSGLIANIITAIIVAMVFFFFFLFTGFAAAYALSAWIGATWAGFLIIAFIYLLAGFIIFKSKDKLLRIPIMNAIIRQLFSKDDEEENEKD